MTYNVFGGMLNLAEAAVSGTINTGWVRRNTQTVICVSVMCVCHYVVSAVHFTPQIVNKFMSCWFHSCVMTEVMHHKFWSKDPPDYVPLTDNRPVVNVLSDGLWLLLMIICLSVKSVSCWCDQTASLTVTVHTTVNGRTTLQLVSLWNYWYSVKKVINCFSAA